MNEIGKIFPFKVRGGRREEGYNSVIVFVRERWTGGVKGKEIVGGRERGHRGRESAAIFKIMDETTKVQNNIYFDECSAKRHAHAIILRGNAKQGNRNKEKKKQSRAMIN